jgi:hypothetical protein
MVIALTLRKQHLAAEAQGDEILPVLDDLLGLHATYPHSPYLQLRARLRSFTPPQLDTTLDAGRAATVGGMRRTLFIESAGLLPLVFAATRNLAARGRARFLLENGLTLPGYEEVAQQVESALVGKALDGRQLRDVVAAAGSLSPVLTVMCDEARLVRWKGSAGWRSTRPTYRRFDEALPSIRLDAWREHAAARALIDRYIRRYGPVSESDIKWWTGFYKAAVTDAIHSIPDLVRVRIDGFEGSFLMHEADLFDAQHGDTPRRDAIALLPVLDPYLQGYIHRERSVNPRHRPFVVDRGGNATSVILAAGRAVGVWDFVSKPTRGLRLLFFESLSAQTRRRILAAASAMAEFLATETTPVIEVDRMRPLSGHTGSFLSPLAG